MNDSTPSSTSRPVAVKYKIIFYVVAWLAALVATDPSGTFLALIYMFPLGLAAFINVHWGNDGGWGVLAVCILVYLVHAWFYFRSRTQRSTLLWLALLVILLVGNVSGCHKMFPGH